ncbi:MAG: efflux RND transporter permease subunit [Leptospiraceae bacterium]|nr:efflux RND transporter permease subunit [Leptospiraceae bacterium]
MRQQIIEFAIRNRKSLAIMAAGIVIAGIWRATFLPVDAVPDITNVQVMINSRTGSLDPEQVEKMVTYPIELELQGIANTQQIRSISKFGLSQITLIFEDGTDIYRARQMISERLQNLYGKLPEGVVPEMAPITTGLGEVFMYTLQAKKDSRLDKLPEKEKLMYLRSYHDFRIRPILRKIKGVGDIDSNGGYEREIHINIIPAKMERYGITIDELNLVLADLGKNYGGGYIENEARQVIVRSVFRLPDLETIRSMPVRNGVFGSVIRLRDIATVSNDHAQRVGSATYNGREAVMGTALMIAGSNARVVALSLQNAVENLELPEDVEIKILYSREFLVNTVLDTVFKNLAEGGILVIIILFALVGNLRAAFLVSLAIPVSMAVALLGMEQFGVSANLMSLGAIDFGLLVDGSIVMIENYMRHLHEIPGQKDLKQKITILKNSCAEVITPVVSGLSIVMIVYTPVLALTGTEGKLFHPMAITVLMALGASLVVAVLLMPALAILVLGDKTDEKEPWLFRKLNVLYSLTLEFSLKHGKLILIGFITFAAFTVFLFMRLGANFIPTLGEGDLVLSITRNSDISLTESLKRQFETEKIIAEYPEVAYSFSRIGTPASATDPMGVHLSDTFLILQKDHDQWPLRNGQRFDKNALFLELKRRLESEVASQDVSATQPIEMRFNEMLEGSRADISLRIYGQDLKILQAAIESASEILATIEGAESIESDPLTALRSSPVLDLVPDMLKISRYELSLPAVANALENAMSGRHIGYYFEEDFRIPIFYHLAENLRQSRAMMARIPVALQDGGSVPLGNLVTFNMSENVTTIARSDSRRYAAVSINLADRDVQSFFTEAREKINQNLKLPEGYTISWGGQFQNLEKARNRFAILLPLTLLAILLILFKSYGNLKDTVLVFLNVPFAMTGGVLALWLRDIDFSVSAAVGFIALSGIAILASSVLLSFFRELKMQGEDIEIIVRKGTKLRLRPVLMTTFVAVLGFLPMATSTGIGSELQKPLATVVIGGLVSSTLLVLVILPILYRWVYRSK